MPTTTDDDPAYDASPHRILPGKASVLSILVASVGTLVILFGLFSSRDDSLPQVQSIPAQPNTVSRWVAAPPPSVKPLTPKPQPPALVMDARGFVDSTARCDAQQRAVAIARTERSAIVVCRSGSGTYEYQGMRLQDRAALHLDDVRPIPAGFEARNEGTTYRLSPKELVVISGDALQSRDAIMEYRVG